MTEPLWLSVARMTTAVRELDGPGSNPVILQWAKDVGAPGYPDDSVAWCALWLNRLCQALQLPLSGTGYDLLRAGSFSAWGVPLVQPALGAVMVFRRPAGHHVGLYLGERPDAYRIFGGNTGNAVTAAWLAKDRLLAIRWPIGVPLPSGEPIHLVAGGSLSTNEA